MIELNLTCKSALTATKDNESGVIEGYASTYNEDQIGDVILPGAFDKVLGENLPLMFFNHDRWGLPIGKWVDWNVDEKGLYIKGQLNLELEEAKNIYSALKFGSLNGLSVGMLLKQDDIEEKDDVRLIKSVYRMPEVSIVSMPCNLEAEITRVKSLENISSIKDFEKCLRDVGASRKEALTLISRAKQLFGNQSDSDNKDVALLNRLNAIHAQSNNLIK